MLIQVITELRDVWWLPSKSHSEPRFVHCESSIPQFGGGIARAPDVTSNCRKCAVTRNCSCHSQSPAATPLDNTGKFPPGEEQRQLSGLMRYMSPPHIQMLLSCLDLSYERAIAFDSRPGLKFLVQKVAGLERAANLYRQAGAAWTIKVDEITENNTVSDENMNNSGRLILPCEGIMRSPSSLTNNNYNEYGDMATFLYRLRASFDQLCETYVDVVLDKDGQHSAVDRIADQPIFFLIAQPDDFPEIRRKESLPRGSLASTTASEEKKDLAPMSETVESLDVGSINLNDKECLNSNTNPTETPDENKSEIPDDLRSDGNLSIMAERESPVDSGDEDVFEEPTESKDDKTAKPFVLADFARQPLYSTSDSETEMRVEDAPAEKDEHADVTEDAVYNVASEKDIANLMGEYKKRKQTRSMPPRRNPFCNSGNASPPLGPPLPSQPVPIEIEQQRRNSLYRDSEAHRKVWAEMLGSVFDLLAQLDDLHFRTLLPVLFHGVRRLTAHATDPGLKQAVAELFHRVAMLYGFSPE
ncbi:hypothetical protein C0J52_05989 [Blattella germanica]|nr:hypothetical protein C0J52_05989 [Blattella germanica]